MSVRVAIWSTIRTGRFQTHVQAPTLPNCFGRPFLSLKAIGRFGVTFSHTCAGAHALTFLQTLASTHKLTWMCALKKRNSYKWLRNLLRTLRALAFRALVNRIFQLHFSINARRWYSFDELLYCPHVFQISWRNVRSDLQHDYLCVVRLFESANTWNLDSHFGRFAFSNMKTVLTRYFKVDRANTVTTTCSHKKPPSNQCDATLPHCCTISALQRLVNYCNISSSLSFGMCLSHFSVCSSVSILSCSPSLFFRQQRRFVRQYLWRLNLFIFRPFLHRTVPVCSASFRLFVL